MDPAVGGLWNLKFSTFNGVYQENYSQIIPGDLKENDDLQQAYNTALASTAEKVCGGGFSLCLQSVGNTLGLFFRKLQENYHVFYPESQEFLHTAVCVKKGEFAQSQNASFSFEYEWPAYPSKSINHHEKQRAYVAACRATSHLGIRVILISVNLPLSYSDHYSANDRTHKRRGDAYVQALVESIKVKFINESNIVIGGSWGDNFEENPLRYQPLICSGYKLSQPKEYTCKVASAGSSGTSLRRVDFFAVLRGPETTLLKCKAIDDLNDEHLYLHYVSNHARVQLEGHFPGDLQKTRTDIDELDCLIDKSCNHNDYDEQLKSQEILNDVFSVTEWPLQRIEWMFSLFCALQNEGVSPEVACAQIFIQPLTHEEVFMLKERMGKSPGDAYRSFLWDLCRMKINGIDKNEYNLFTLCLMSDEDRVQTILHELSKSKKNQDLEVFMPSRGGGFITSRMTRGSPIKGLAIDVVTAAKCFVEEEAGAAFMCGQLHTTGLSEMSLENLKKVAHVHTVKKYAIPLFSSYFKRHIQQTRNGVKSKENPKIMVSLKDLQIALVKRLEKIKKFCTEQHLDSSFTFMMKIKDPTLHKDGFFGLLVFSIGDNLVLYSIPEAEGNNEVYISERIDEEKRTSKIEGRSRTASKPEAISVKKTVAPSSLILAYPDPTKNLETHSDITLTHYHLPHDATVFCLSRNLYASTHVEQYAQCLNILFQQSALQEKNALIHEKDWFESKSKHFLSVKEKFNANNSFETLLNGGATWIEMTPEVPGVMIAKSKRRYSIV